MPGLTNKESYRQLCSSFVGLPIFMKDWWLDQVCTDWNVAIVQNGDQISGVWAYPIEQKMGVRLLRTPMLTPYLGPHIFFPPDLKQGKRDSFEYETTAQLLAQMPEAKVWHLAISPGYKQVGILNAHDFEVSARQTYLMYLEGDEKALFSQLHEGHRRKIKKADKELSIADEPELIDKLWTYHNSTLSDKEVAVPYTQEQVQSLFKSCREQGSSALWVARKEDDIQAIVWQVWDDQRSYYLMGAKNPQANDNMAMTTLLWHAIKKAHNLGHQYFDFEGSMDSGVEKFFRNFGADKELYLTVKKNNALLWKLKEALR